MFKMKLLRVTFFTPRNQNFRNYTNITAKYLSHVQKDTWHMGPDRLVLPKNGGKSPATVPLIFKLEEE